MSCYPRKKIPRRHIVLIIVYLVVLTAVLFCSRV
jgi:hypothetical protein